MDPAIPSADLLIAFFITTAVFAYIPGPAMLYVAAQTLAGGRSAGLLATLGIHLGCYVHVFAAAAGLSVLFHAVPMLYLAVKLAGAAYLCWLGLSLLRKAKPEPSLVQERRPVGFSARTLFESMMVEILNPKTALFFLAFLPQFVDVSATLPVWLQFIVLGTMVNLMFSSADIVCVFLAGAILQRVKSSGRVQRMLRAAGGVILVGLGVRLAMQQR